MAKVEFAAGKLQEFGRDINCLVPGHKMHTNGE